MGSVGLLYVGAVLFLNGTALLGWTKAPSQAPLNIFVGLLQVVTPFYLIFTANGDAAAILGASGLFLFGFTYLYVAMNNLMNLDGSGLGWFCGYVAIAALVYVGLSLRDGTGAGLVNAVLWLSWAFLWGLFWLLLARGMGGLTRYTGAVCATQGIITGLIPAFILLAQPDLFDTPLAIFVAAVGIVLDVLYWFLVKPAPASQPAGSAANA